ncbi:unnamed protein product [Microthlaspi erraticum]|uniref:NTF2 domain-containing protein n=1 Tax=Microthlaspi erraticum TaxID=1685480 RepID=A0A6D2JZM4_9BRAS|nr:unnamed protein product [Microthlaspi erraticum]
MVEKINQKPFIIVRCAPLFSKLQPSSLFSSVFTASFIKSLSVSGVMSENETYAETVSRDFVKLYYRTLNESPQFLHTLYNDYCLFNRLYPETHVKKTVWSKEDVKDEFLAVRLEDFTAEIETSIGVPYFMECRLVIAFVNGWMKGKKDNVSKKFTQTFLLAQQDNRFCVVNDILKYKEQIQACPVTEDESEPVGSTQLLPHELASTENSVSRSKGEDDDEWFMVLGL